MSVVTVKKHPSSWGPQNVRFPGSQDQFGTMDGGDGLECSLTHPGTGSQSGPQRGAVE